MTALTPSTTRSTGLGGKFNDATNGAKKYKKSDAAMEKERRDRDIKKAKKVLAAAAAAEEVRCLISLLLLPHPLARD